MNRPCRIAGCPRPAAPAARLCHTHRHRLWRNGDVHQKHRSTDPHAIDTAVRDRRALPGMSPTERRTAGQQLSNLGLPAAEIARIFSVTPRTVHRWRAMARQTTA